MTIAAAVWRPAYDALLSFSYAVGRGAPFLLLGLFVGTVGAWLARMDRARQIRRIESEFAAIRRRNAWWRQAPRRSINRHAHVKGHYQNNRRH
jgi:hypothetical protein